MPEWLGGVYINGNVYGGMKIADIDSLLAGIGPGTQVTGLGQRAGELTGHRWCG